MSDCDKCLKKLYGSGCVALNERIEENCFARCYSVDELRATYKAMASRVLDRGHRKEILTECENLIKWNSIYAELID